ncbi:MAG: CsgG/HfaB family protein [Candidatus Zhuqueibacterota bacterium]
MKRCMSCLTALILLLSVTSSLYSGGKWYNYYDDGVKNMAQGNWARAIENFNEALKVKPRDTKQIKTYGMHFIEYFPHRERGICFYNLGMFKRAALDLSISLKQEYSARAQEYLSKIGSDPMDREPLDPKLMQQPAEEPVKPTEMPHSQPPAEVASSGIKLVGERMALAVLPFQSIGMSNELGEVNVVEQMMTTFYNLNRFKLFERTQLEKILEEQKLGMTGVLDASTAAEIGKGIGVDAIVLGAVTRAGRNIQISARLIDTETAEIITAQDELSASITIQELKDMVGRLASKISLDLPLVEGYVIAVNGENLTLDIGINQGIKKGMKCIIYREGEEIVHPITKKILGKETQELAEVKLNQVYSAYSIGRVIGASAGLFEIGNKVVTK